MSAMVDIVFPFRKMSIKPDQAHTAFVEASFWRRREAVPAADCEAASVYGGSDRMKFLEIGV